MIELMTRIRRREALAALGGAGAATVLGTRWLSRPAQAAGCILTPEVTEGPYWVPNHLTRRDITENRKGLALRLHLTVVNSSTCRPIKGADVEIWHADAAGVYSGVAGNSGHFLRGHQKANASGVVIFDTIYPGWYRGRTPHIHVKVHVGGSVVHTGQLFFRDAVSDTVYGTSAYKSRGEPDTTNGQDGIYAQAGAGKSRLVLKRRGSGYLGSLTLGVRV
jgi:protocatechuate 3,4-dioxygenase beta subunit